MARIIAYQTDECVTEWTRQDKTATELAELLRASGLWCIIPRGDGKITAILLGTSYHFTIEDTDIKSPRDVEA